ncbi:hypothetical protein ABZ215_24885 [Amycolatopsis sp. NPDC006131]|uniref:hypothetical protein n=1 Tax=Amycolatopsis sp. NPDC006131 TaxID=3156731 RepID=UPI00339E6A97
MNLVEVITRLQTLRDEHGDLWVLQCDGDRLFEVDSISFSKFDGDGPACVVLDTGSEADPDELVDPEDNEADEAIWTASQTGDQTR